MILIAEEVFCQPQIMAKAMKPGQLAGKAVSVLPYTICPYSSVTCYLHCPVAGSQSLNLISE